MRELINLHNNGVNGSGEIILLDFGELYFAKEQAKEHLATKPWRSSSCFQTKLESSVRDYYDSQMLVRATPEMLDSLWSNAPLRR